MTTVHVQLDDVTYQRIRQKAAAAGQTPDEYLAARAREEAAASESDSGGDKTHDGRGVIGLFADEPEAVDEMLEIVMRMREEQNRSLLRRIDHVTEALREPEEDA